MEVDYYEKMRDLFNSYDSDGSGYIDIDDLAGPIFDIICETIEPTAEQMKIVTAISKKVSKDIIREMDKSGNEVVDFDEFRQSHHAIQDKRNDVVAALSRASNLYTLQTELGMTPAPLEQAL